ncbi:MAG: UDP-glucuronic acid decarboxylase family protein [Terriglobales bacterium]|jgi:dTDP-glucose 4,6-dehydratase
MNMRPTKTRRALVTGGAGFLGSHLCDGLLGEGYSVVAADNLLTGHLANIAHLRHDSRFEFVEKDVSEAGEWGELDYVFHFASPASPVDYAEHGIETLRVGSYGTFEALETALRRGAKFMMASTSECYGDPMVHPQPETYWGNVNPVGPRSVYDEAKRFSEAVTMAYHRYHRVDTRIVRIFNTYGPRMQIRDGRVIPNFMWQALRGETLTVYGDGTQTRSFCYVGDEVEGILRLARSSDLESEHEPVNIGNPTEFTILECARKVIATTGSASRIEFEALPQDDPKQRCPDISKAKRLLGWEPKVDLESGLKLSLEYFRQAVVEKEQLPSRAVR